jgi:hypothetical protein|nr:MAG TPA: hypothetical protein [Caudoviricetes sp.]
MAETIYCNLTPHALKVRTLDGSTITIAPDERGAARVIYDRFPPEHVRIDGHEISVSVAGAPREIIGLPDAEPGVVLIVAKAVSDAAPAYRGDLMSPGKLIRNEDGTVIGCDGLTRRA